MSKRFLQLCLWVIIGAASAFGQEMPKWITPGLEGYGRIVYDPSLAVQPDKSRDYKIIFAVTSDQTQEGVNSQLWHVARMVNLLAAAKVPKEKIHLVVGIAGKATPVILTDGAYMQRFKKPNPDTALIRQLKKAGVVLYVCSQAAAEHNVDMKKEMNPDILGSLSLMTTLANYELQGYIAIP